VAIKFNFLSSLLRRTIEDFLATRLRFKVTLGISEEAREEFVSHRGKGTQPPKPHL
jgi:hypothetical protein